MAVKSIGLFVFIQALVGLAIVEPEKSCPTHKAECSSEPQDDSDLTSALQLNRNGKKATDTESWFPRHDIPRLPKWFWSSEIKNCPSLPRFQALREPQVVTSPVTLRIVPIILCDPRNPDRKFYTRAYALPGQEPTIPGPTIKANPGEWLNITIINELGKYNPSCLNETLRERQIDEWNLTSFCEINTTNLHTHGLHVSPLPGADNIFEAFEPKTTHVSAVKLPDNHHSGTNWYHPHHHHSTSAQAGGGLLGAIQIPDPEGLVPKEIAKLDSKLIVISLIDKMGANTSITRTTSPVIEDLAGGKFWRFLDNGELASSPNTLDVLVNGLLEPELTLDEGQWMRLNMVYASIEFNIITRFFPLGRKRAGFQCELALLAKDGVYVHEAPRTIKNIYLASGNRADVAIRCSCRKDWGGDCIGAMWSRPELRAVLESGGEGDFGEQEPLVAPPEYSTFGPFKNVGEKTVHQLLMRINVRRAFLTPWKPAPRPLPQFSVRRPCYLVDLRDQEPEPENQGVISMPRPGPPTYPQWQVVYWSNVSTPDDFEGEPFQMDSPPIKTWQIGTMQELTYAGEFDAGRGPFEIAGLRSHPAHLHVTPYQVVALKCSDGRWLKEGGCDNSYYVVGDWHDDLMQAGAAAVVRFQVVDFTGPYVFHCHILAHEDQGMMTYFEVEGEEGTKWPEAKKIDPTCYDGFFEA